MESVAERRVVPMGEMQAAASKGLSCPKCASVASEVVRTLRGDGVIVRERRCLHCKTKLPKSYETF